MATLSEIAANMPGINVTQALAVLAASVNTTNENLDIFFICSLGLMVYFMPCGFAFLEAGAVRTKHLTGILIMNVLDQIIGCIAYWLFGYALAYGEPGNRFAGSSFWASAYLPDSRMFHWFFQYSFCSTSSTIVSGAIAERCRFQAYMIYSFLVTGFVFPVVEHWAWTPTGWLKLGITARNGTLTSQYHDFSGSGVVHLTGAVTALVACAIMGPRINRFNKQTGETNPMPGHSVPLVCLGAFVLYFGFVAFNASSGLSITKPGDGAIMGIACTNSVLVSAASALFVMFVSRLRGKHWSLLRMVNGSVVGMVASCAGCDVYYPWGAVATGIVAGGLYMTFSEIVPMLKLDDPADAISVHCGGGISGPLCVAFFQKERGIVFAWNQQSGLDLAMQLVAVLSIAAWAGGCAIVVFGTLRLTKLLRLPADQELKGVDMPMHGELAYPPDAYGDGWGFDDPEMKSVPTDPVTGIRKQYNPFPQPVTKLERSVDLGLGISNPVMNMYSSHI